MNEPNAKGKRRGVLERNPHGSSGNEIEGIRQLHGAAGVASGEVALLVANVQDDVAALLGQHASHSALERETGRTHVSVCTPTPSSMELWLRAWHGGCFRNPTEDVNPVLATAA